MLAQGPTREDYKRAVAYQWGNLINKKVFNANVQPMWFGDSTGLVLSPSTNHRNFSKNLRGKSIRVNPGLTRKG